MGLFGLGEILFLAEKKIKGSGALGKIDGILPTREDWRKSRGAIGRSSILGFFLGILPDGGGSLSSIVGYGVQKKFSKNPEQFGKGAIDGLAATETADNASWNSAFIPLLTLGLPPNSVLALLFGVLMLHNVTPGPTMIEDHPNVFWGVIASMYIGNALLLLFNLPAIGAFVQILRIPAGLMFPFVVVIAFCGVYSANNQLFDVFVAAVFGIIGFLLKKYRFDMTPVILGFILGPVIENGFRRTMVMSDGSMGIFFECPGTIIIMMVIIVAIAGAMAYMSHRRKNSVITEAAKESADVS